MESALNTWQMSQTARYPYITLSLDIWLADGLNHGLQVPRKEWYFEAFYNVTLKFQWWISILKLCNLSLLITTVRKHNNLTTTPVTQQQFKNVFPTFQKGWFSVWNTSFRDLRVSS